MRWEDPAELHDCSFPGSERPRGQRGLLDTVTALPHKKNSVSWMQTAGGEKRFHQFFGEYHHFCLYHSGNNSYSQNSGNILQNCIIPLKEKFVFHVLLC